MTNFVTQVAGLGDKYQPSNTALLIDSLNQHSTLGNEVVKRLITATNFWNNTINERKAIYEPLNSLTTKIIKALRASGVPVQTIDDAKAHADRIRGHNVGKSKSAKAAKVAKGEGEEPVKSVSTSQQSFDERAKNLEKLVELLASLPKYAPNEAELKVEALRALVLKLKEQNASVATAEFQLNKVRAERDHVLYAEEKGLVDTGLLVKNYIGSIFDSKAPEYKNISKIRLVNLN